MTRRRESGMSLVIALVTLLVVASAGAALLSSAERTAKSNVSTRDELAARWAAEAGVERARWALGRDASYSGESIRFDAFDVSVRVESGADGRRTVVSRAAGRGRTARVEATLRTSPGLPVVDAWRED